MSTLRVAQIRSKIKENGFRAHNFPRLRRAERGFAFGTVLVSPKSATLTVTIIPVSPEGARNARREASSSTETGPAWFTARSVRRQQQRRSSAAHARAAAVDAARASDGGVSDGDGTRSIVAGVGNMQAVPPVAAEAAADAAARAAVPVDAGPADAPPPDAPMADASASVLD